MNTAIERSEETKSGGQGITTIFLTNGHNINFPTERLIEFINVNELNLVEENHGKGLVCDPNGTDDYSYHFVDAEKHLDDNWDKVIEKYYLDVIIKGSVSW
jgi:hypothetical protein